MESGYRPVWGNRPLSHAMGGSQTLQLLSSHTKQVICLLEDKTDALAHNSQAAKVLRGVANYLRRNQPYMDYAEYLRRGAHRNRRD